MYYFHSCHQDIYIYVVLKLILIHNFNLLLDFERKTKSLKNMEESKELQNKVNICSINELFMNSLRVE